MHGVNPSHATVAPAPPARSRTNSFAPPPARPSTVAMTSNPRQQTVALHRALAHDVRHEAPHVRTARRPVFIQQEMPPHDVVIHRHRAARP